MQIQVQSTKYESPGLEVSLSKEILIQTEDTKRETILKWLSQQ